MKIVLGVNTLTQVQQMAYANHCQLWYRLGKTHPDWQFIFYASQRMSIDRMRNEAAKIAIEQEADFLVFLDDDVLVEHDSLEKLLAPQYDVCASVTCIRGYPYYPMLFDFSKSDNHYVENWETREPKTLYPSVDAVGFSYVAIKVSTLKEVPAPWFMTGPNFTEDVYYCRRLKTLKPDATITYCKTVKTGHILTPEFIHPDERNQRLAFDRSVEPALREEAVGKQDRGGEYFEPKN